MQDCKHITPLGLEIRTLSPDDWRVWRELRISALTLAPEAYNSKLAEWTGNGDVEQRWRDRLASVALNYAAFVHNRPAGLASATAPDETRTSHLISMWVEPFARGRTAAAGLGVSDALVEAVVAWARSNGAARVMLDTAHENKRARSLYRRHGFVDVTPIVAPADHPMVLELLS